MQNQGGGGAGRLCGRSVRGTYGHKATLSAWAAFCLAGDEPPALLAGPAAVAAQPAAPPAPAPASMPPVSPAPPAASSAAPSAAPSPPLLGGDIGGAWFPLLPQEIEIESSNAILTGWREMESVSKWMPGAERCTLHYMRTVLDRGHQDAAVDECRHYLPRPPSSSLVAWLRS